MSCSVTGGHTTREDSMASTAFSVMKNSGVATPAAVQSLNFGPESANQDVAKELQQLRQSVTNLSQVILNLNTKLDTATAHITNTDKLVNQLLQEVQSLKDAKEAASLVTEDVLQSPMETEADFDRLCNKLEDHQFKKKLVS